MARRAPAGPPKARADADAGPRRRVRRRLDRWLTVNLSGSVAQSTEDDYVDTVRLHLVPALGRKPLAKLTVADLDRLWKAKRDAGYSSNSVRIMRTVLRRALGQAVREGIVARNVAGLSMVARFRQHRARQAEAQMAAGTLWRDHGLIFASEVGTPMDVAAAVAVAFHGDAGCAGEGAPVAGEHPDPMDPRTSSRHQQSDQRARDVERPGALKGARRVREGTY